MSSDFSRPVDAWSRFVAYCSLVVALGTLGWVWLGDGATVSDSANRGNAQPEDSYVASIQKMFDDEAATRKQRDDEIREAWRVEQQGQLQRYKNSADKMIAQHQSLITQLSSDVLAATFTAGAAVGEVVPADGSTAIGSTADGSTVVESERTTDSVNPREESTTESTAGSEADNDKIDNDKIADAGPSKDMKIGDPSAETSEPDDDRDDDRDDAFFSPLLTQVFTSRKTDGSNDEQGIIDIRNNGGGKAMLAKIKFTPSNDDDAIFEVSSPLSLTTTNDDDVVQLVFAQQDNLADELGKHGIYKRQLSPTAFGVDSGDALRIRLAIANEKHIGWGFRGQLEISYNGHNPLVIEGAELVFVSDPQPIVQK